MYKYLSIKFCLVILLTVNNTSPIFGQECSVQIMPVSSDTTLCMGDTLRLSAHAELDGELMWSTGSMDSSIHVSTDGLYVVTLSSDTCITSDTVQVAFSPSPEILGLDVTTECEGDSTSFTAVIQADTSSIVTWDFADGNEVEQQELDVEVPHLYEQAGTYEATLTVIDNIGCQAVDSITALVLAVPEVALNAEDNCFQDSTAFSYEINCPMGAGCTATLFPGEGSGITLPLDTSEVTFIYSTPDTFQVELYVESAAGCFASETLEQVIFPAPNAEFSGLDTEYCQGDPASELIPLESGGFFEGPFLETVNDTSTFFDPMEVGSDIIISYTITNVFNCSSQVEQLVENIHFTPSISLEGEDACFMEESVFEVESDCEAGNCNFLLDLGNGVIEEFSDVDGDFTYEYIYETGPENFSVFLEVSTENFCTSSAILEHEVFPVPNASFSGLEENYCQNDPKVELIPEQSGGTFTGPTGGYISYSADSSMTFFDPVESGENISIVYEIENQFGCSAISEFVIDEVFFTPVAELISDPTCFQDTTIFLNLTDCAGSNCELFLDFGDGGMIDNIPSDVPEFGHYYGSVGTYTITFIAGTSMGCADTLNFEQTVNPLPSPIFTDLDETYCNNDPAVVLIPEQTGGTFTGPGVTMQGDGTGLFTPAIPDENLTVTYEITNEFQCSQSSSQIIDEVFAAPEVILQGLETQYCEGDLADTLLNLPVGGTYLGNNPYLIDEVEGDSVAIFIPNTIGVSTVTYRYEDENSCSETFSLDVRVDSLPVANLGPDTAILSGQSITLSNAVNNANYTYEWSGGGSSAEKEIDGPGFYFLTVIDNASGCSANDTIYVDFANSTSDLAIVLQEVEVWPNPVDDFLNIGIRYNTLPVKGLDLTVVDLFGRVIHQQHLLPGSGQSTGIHTDHWPSGVYALRLNGIGIRKIVKP